MKTDKIPTTPRLSRKAIREGLQSVPMDVLLLGAAGAKTTKLTAKQRAFAEGIAQGKTKAGAYRDAYGSKGKPATASRRGQELARHGAVAAQIEALQLANEAMRYATPAALRALVVQKLTEHAISDDVKPAQRLQALKLLGTVTEVAAFTERREIVTVRDPGAAREALISGIRAALAASATDAKIVSVKNARVTGVTLPAGSELSPSDPELAHAAAVVEPQPGGEPLRADPTVPHPPEPRATPARDLLSNPHTELHQNSDVTQTSQSATRVTPVTLVSRNTDARVTPVTLPVVEGGGAIETWGAIGNGYGETPPSGNWVEK